VYVHRLLTQKLDHQTKLE